MLHHLLVFKYCSGLMESTQHNNNTQRETRGQQNKISLAPVDNKTGTCKFNSVFMQVDEVFSHTRRRTLSNE